MKKLYIFFTLLLQLHVFFGQELQTFINSENYLAELATTYQLELLVKDCSTELERVIKVANWVHNLWEHNGDNLPVKSDALSILHEVVVEGKRFRCVEYAIIMEACLVALNIQCRTLYLKTKDCQEADYGAGHVVNEVYLRSLNKWVFVDVQANVIIMSQGELLNAIELQQALFQGNSLEYLTNTDVNVSDYSNYIYPYLYYFEVSYEPDFYGVKDLRSLMLIPENGVKPTLFQKQPISYGIDYTESIADFYKKP